MRRRPLPPSSRAKQRFRRRLRRAMRGASVAPVRWLRRRPHASTVGQIFAAAVQPLDTRPHQRSHHCFLAALFTLPRSHDSTPLSPVQYPFHPEATMPPHPYTTIFPRHVPETPHPCAPKQPRPTLVFPRFARAFPASRCPYPLFSALPQGQTATMSLIPTPYTPTSLRHVHTSPSCPSRRSPT